MVIISIKLTFVPSEVLTSYLKSFLLHINFNTPERILFLCNDNSFVGDIPTPTPSV